MDSTPLWKFILINVFAYLYGSVNFAYVFVKLIKGRDLRKEGFGNPGTENAFKVGGPLAGIPTALLDFSKGIGPMILATYFCGWTFQGNPWQMILLAGMATLGHDFPFYWGFKGGDGLGVLYGMLLFFSPGYWILGNCLQIPYVIFNGKDKKGLQHRNMFGHLVVIIVVSAVAVLFMVDSGIKNAIPWWKWVVVGGPFLFDGAHFSDMTIYGYGLFILLGFYVLFRRALRRGFFQDLKDGIPFHKAFLLRALFIMYPKGSRYRNPGDDVAMVEITDEEE